MHVSISHTRYYAVAYAVAEGDEQQRRLLNRPWASRSQADRLSEVGSGSKPIASSIGCISGLAMKSFHGRPVR